jgi:hypothetical protein
MSPTRELDTLLTIDQLAERLNVSVRTVERQPFPCIYLGARTKRYIWDDVLEYMRDHQQR